MRNTKINKIIFNMCYLFWYFFTISFNISFFIPLLFLRVKEYIVCSSFPYLRAKHFFIVPIDLQVELYTCCDFVQNRSTYKNFAM